IERGDIDAIAVVAALARGVEAADEVHQRRLARTRGSHDGDEGAVLDAQVDILQRHHLGLGAGGIDLAERACLDDRGGGIHRAARSPVISRSPAWRSPDTSVAVPSVAPTRTITGSGLPPTRRYTVARVAPTRLATEASQRRAWSSSRLARKPAKSSR